MGKLRSVESPKERVALARDAGLGRLSFVSVVAGVFAAYGAVAVLLALAGAVASGLGIDTDFTDQEWRQVGVGGAVVLGLVLFLSYLFGGYIAGRMARRSGLLNGLAVFVLGVILVVVAGAVASVLADTDEFVDRLRELGVPTTADQWGQIGTIAGIVTLVAMLAGSLLGGRLGERWHAKLLARALDPAVGPGPRQPAPSDAAADRGQDDNVDLRDHRPAEDRTGDTGALPTREGDDADRTTVATYRDGSTATRPERDQGR